MKTKRSAVKPTTRTGVRRRWRWGEVRARKLETSLLSLMILRRRHLPPLTTMALADEEEPRWRLLTVGRAPFVVWSFSRLRWSHLQGFFCLSLKEATNLSRLVELEEQGGVLSSHAPKTLLPS